MGVADLVLHEALEDLPQPLVLSVLLLRSEQRRRQPLDPRHVREVLDDGDLVVPTHVAGTTVPIQVTDVPLLAPAFFEHYIEVHGALRMPSA